MGPGPQRLPEAPAYKTGGAVLTACVPAFGARSGRGRRPRLSHNLWGWGVMSPPSLLSHAVWRSATVCASSWRGGGRSCPPSLACGAVPVWRLAAVLAGVYGAFGET